MPMPFQQLCTPLATCGPMLEDQRLRDAGRRKIAAAIPYPRVRTSSHISSIESSRKIFGPPKNVLISGHVTTAANQINPPVIVTRVQQGRAWNPTKDSRFFARLGNKSRINARRPAQSTTFQKLAQNMRGAPTSELNDRRRLILAPPLSPHRFPPRLVFVLGETIAKLPLSVSGCRCRG